MDKRCSIGYPECRIEVAPTDPGHLTTISVRSGRFDQLSASQGGAISLSVTESLPLIGALLALPVTIAHRLRTRQFQAIHAADVFVVTYTVLTLLLYIPPLPGHAQFTVRYLFALYPLAVYELIRPPWIRTAVRTRHRLFAWTYTTGLRIHSQLPLTTSILLDATIPAAMQALPKHHPRRPPRHLQPH